MEAEMKMVFHQKVQEKENKLKQSEEELYSRHKEMKEALEKQKRDLEEKKRKVESGRPPTPERSVSVNCIRKSLVCRPFLTGKEESLPTKLISCFIPLKKISAFRRFLPLLCSCAYHLYVIHS